MTKMDKKFYGEIRKVKDNSVVPEDQWVVFLAKDNAFASILPLYLEACIRMKCDKWQIKSVERLVADVENWRAQNQELLKKPDAEGEDLLP